MSNPILTKRSTLSSSISLSSSSTASQTSSAPASSFLSSTVAYTPFTMKQVIISLAVILATVSLSQACFIRNCPKGGKRALDNNANAGLRPCIGCGPGNAGQCVGPNICCSPKFGCHMGMGHAEVCQKENESTTPCYVQGDVCGPRDSGKCVADGICCDSETCTMADVCRVADQSSKKDPEKVLRLLERLLRTRVD